MSELTPSGGYIPKHCFTQKETPRGASPEDRFLICCAQIRCLLIAWIPPHSNAQSTSLCIWQSKISPAAPRAGHTGGFHLKVEFDLKKTLDLTTGSISRKLILFALPLLFGSLVQQLCPGLSETHQHPGSGPACSCRLSPNLLSVLFLDGVI